MSIGQGDLALTPIWINAYIGAIANGGNIMKPFVVNRVEKDGGIAVINKPKVIGKLEFSKKEFDIVKKGMELAVKSGTARLLKNIPVSLAAKTGTAQVSKGNLNSFLAVYGPTEDPEIVVTIFAENIGKDQGVTLRVAKKFLGWWFGHQ